MRGGILPTGTVSADLKTPVRGNRGAIDGSAMIGVPSDDHVSSKGGLGLVLNFFFESGRFQE